MCYSILFSQRQKMKRVLLLLALVVGAALAAEEPQEVVAEPEGEAEGKMSKAMRCIFTHLLCAVCTA